MSTANTTPTLAIQQLIEQRLDAIDGALLGLLPRHDRLAAVAQVESRIRQLVGEGAAVPANLQAAPPDLVGWVPTAQRRRSRLAVSAGVLGIVALGLLFAVPVTYFIAEILAEVLGEVGAIALLGAHGVAVALGGTAAVGLGICALVSLNRRRDQLAGHGWAIAGLCTGTLPMLMAGAAVLVIGLQFGVGQFVSVSASQVAGDGESPCKPDSEEEASPAVAGSVPLYGVPSSQSYPGSYPHPSPVTTAGNESHAMNLEPPVFEERIVPTPPECLRAAPNSASPQPEPPQPPTELQPQPPTEPRPASRLDAPSEPVLMPESAPAISTQPDGR